MRIIAGEFRGRTILAPTNLETRPITDRVKQSVFDVLSPYLPDAVIYDLFAGTGSMGLESVSRGSKLIAFFEADRSALTLLKKNIATFRVETRTRVFPGDLFSHFAPGNLATVPKADVVFLDPPYKFLIERQQDLKHLARQISSHSLAPGGQVVFRHDAKDSLDLPGLEAFDVRNYGSMTVELLKARASE